MDNKNARIPLGFYKIPSGLSEEELSKLSEAIYHDVRKKIKEKTLCHLLQNDKIEYCTDLCGSLEEIFIFDDYDHDYRSLKKCKNCGQLYLYQFLEFTMIAKEDPQYWTWVPVKSFKEAKKLSRMDSSDLNYYFGLHRDYRANDEVAPDHAKLAHKPKGENEKFLVGKCSATEILDAEIKAAEAEAKNNN